MMTEFATVQPTQQILTFLYAFLYGAMLCWFYDILRGIRRIFRPNNITLFFQDVIFCVFSAILVFCFLLVRCNGQLRIYVLLSLAIGFGVFRFVASKSIIIITASICRFFRRTTNKITPYWTRATNKCCRFLLFLLAKCKNILKRKKKPLEKQTNVDV